MTIFGKQLSEYVSFAKLFIGLILIVAIARLALSLGGVPNSTAKWFSITVVTLVGVVYYAVRAHTSGFGSYKRLLPTYILLSLSAQIVVIVGIIIAIQTGHDNIFSTPEYSGGEDGKTWLHVAAHVILGLIVAPLITWLVGSLIMLVTKKLAPGGSGSATARA